ncbi:penicillin-binding protein activator [Legionella nagasakiensis]|uniref:penicillin-binding protein activator n=1 Tax=Legionella nagasakiensis TaxID=535290 RepID=UPI001056AB3F|nr:penicillin-binding protein activator [Legionella nagasakiensis]
MLSNSLLIKWVFIFCCVLVLSCCTKVTDSHLQVNQQLASPYTMPAAAYLALAKNQTGEAQQSLLMKAAGRLIYDGQWRQGRTILLRMKHLSGELTDEKDLLLAKIDLILEQPRSALNRLAKVQSVASMPIYYQAQFHEMLAQAYQSTGNATESVGERIKLEHLLPDEASRANNLRALWLTLTTLPPAELNTLAIEAPDDSELKGWMQLALISRHDYDQPQAMLAALATWQEDYPNHSAHSILQRTDAERRLFLPPKNMALLLPLSGPLAGPGHAVKDGFMAAYSASKEAGHVKIRFYNTNAANAAALYQQAISEGADYIVGPLTKMDVAAVAAMEHPVPTLLLNDLNSATKNNAYQFGLSPSNEARQVAAKTRKNGYVRALIIAPEGSWGDEIVAAFSSQWQANGGRIIDALRYHANENLNASVRDFLHITDSEARKKQLKQLLGRNIESTPRRRQDFDMIFLLAYPSKARQIVPLLQYYYAGDVPVYATSSVYAGTPNSMKDRDLNGVIFCDMPWVFNHHMGHKHWPEQYNSYNRLYALGMDSYALSRQLNQLLLFPAMGVSDKSGILYLNPNGQIARILAWGQFKQGMAERISDHG